MRSLVPIFVALLAATVSASSSVAAPRRAKFYALAPEMTVTQAQVEQARKECAEQQVRERGLWTEHVEQDFKQLQSQVTEVAHRVLAALEGKLRAQAKGEYAAVAQQLFGPLMKGAVCKTHENAEGIQWVRCGHEDEVAKLDAPGFISAAELDTMVEEFELRAYSRDGVAVVCAASSFPLKFADGSQVNVVTKTCFAGNYLNSKVLPDHQTAYLLEPLGSNADNLYGFPNLHLDAAPEPDTTKALQGEFENLLLARKGQCLLHKADDLSAGATEYFHDERERLEDALGVEAATNGEEEGESER